MTKPYYKKSHRAWYVNLAGKPHRLGTDEVEAKKAYERLQTNQYTVGEIVDKFLAVNRHPATQKFYERPLAKLKNQFGKVLTSDLKPYHITGYRNTLRAIKTCFKWAEAQEYLDRSPLTALKVPRATSRGDEAYLTPEQWEKFIQSVDNSDLYTIAIVIHETGCRPEEARRVEARYFDRNGRCWAFPKAKSKGKILRVVHLSDRVFNICQRLSLKYPDGPIFRNGNKLWSAQTLYLQFKKFGITPYYLRHTFATEAIIRGVDLQTIAVLMGHQDLKMLSKIYQHIRCRSDFIKQGLRKAVGQ